MKSKIKAALFDIDDTLFDRNLAQTKVLELIVRKLPSVFLPFPREQVMEAFLESDRLTIADFDAGAPSTNLRDTRSRLFLRQLGISESYADIITGIYVQDYPAAYAPVAGAITVVEELSKKYQVGVVSNSMPDVQYRKLETLGLRNMLSCVVLSEEIGIRKPDPGIFLHAVKTIGRQPAECLYIGDSYTSDIVGAKSAGMQACWFNRISASLADNEIKPDFIVKDLLEIPKLLRLVN